MMMLETVQRGRAQDVLPDTKVLNRFMLDEDQGKIREQRITRNREIHPQENKRDPKRPMRFVESALCDRWSRRTKFDDTYRVLSLFTLRF